jgi:WD repeat-containing protein 89
VRQQTVWQSSGNCDDITALQYHPTEKSQLLSGADDGLVSLFDTTVQDETDSLVQGFNHAPIHKAGFLTDLAIYALSSDQKLSIHSVASFETEQSTLTQPIDFGDLRPLAQCDYVIDILREAGQVYVVAGSHAR